MRYYGLNEIVRTHKLTFQDLLMMIREGYLKWKKTGLNEVRKGSFRYTIPESELVKLLPWRIDTPIAYKSDRPKRERKPQDYATYIRSKRYLKKRAERLRRDGWQCQKCGTGKNLEVHHVSYEHLGQAGEIDDMITLCRECHQKVHSVDLRDGSIG